MTEIREGCLCSLEEREMGRESSRCKRLDPVLGVIFFFWGTSGGALMTALVMKLNTSRPCRSKLFLLFFLAMNEHEFT
jgi:hypothetical protein